MGSIPFYCQATKLFVHIDMVIITYYVLGFYKWVNVIIHANVFHIQNCRIKLSKDEREIKWSMVTLLALARHMKLMYTYSAALDIECHIVSIIKKNFVLVL
ncbi:hypothetical protein BDC45DRAFT_538128 [Circinella umbellata]|nr:hypothetical protein BDC45DRAFT_538128 [Circinella umbellata]